MKKEKTQAGLLFSLEKIEFDNCNWIEFLNEIKKKISGWEYNSDINEWFIPKSQLKIYAVLEGRYITDVLHKNQVRLF